METDQIRDISAQFDSLFSCFGNGCNFSLFNFRKEKHLTVATYILQISQLKDSISLWKFVSDMKYIFYFALLMSDTDRSYNETPIIYYPSFYDNYDDSVTRRKKQMYMLATEAAFRRAAEIKKNLD